MDDDAPADSWSPADNPYAIAVSEAQWWLWTAALCGPGGFPKAATQSGESTPTVHCGLTATAVRRKMEKRVIQHLARAVRQALIEAGELHEATP